MEPSRNAAAASPDSAPTSPVDQTLPSVTVVVPARNEEPFIERCIASILGSDYPGDRLEVVVVDGQSDDRTVEIVRRLADRDSRVRLIENPRRVTPVAMNLGVGAAHGEVVFFACAHSEAFLPDYFRRCVGILQEHPEVWCAGGACVATGEGLAGRAIAAAMSSPVGAGNSHYRLGDYKGYVATVIGGYWRWVFDRIGGFDEDLVRNQDDELNFRIALAGGKVYLDSDISYGYCVRKSFRTLARQYYQYGFWRVRTMQKHGRPATMRQVAPLGFVAFWIALGLGTAVWRPLGNVLALFAGGYAVMLAYGAVGVACRAGLMCGLLAAPAFVIMHFGYGLGSLVGVWTFLVLRRGSKIDAARYPMSR
jgi:succinoglycan biosynthesis protein ExoA